MKKYILITLLSVFVNLTMAQNSLSGIVKDSINGTTLPGATIYIPDLRVGVSSGENGAYSLKNIPKGTYTVEVDLIGYGAQAFSVKIVGDVTKNISLIQSYIEESEVVVTGNSSATTTAKTPQPITEVTNDYLNENSSTNIIDAISKVPGVSAMSDGQSISKPVIRGLGYNRVLTIDDGVEQMDQAWFDEFGIEADPDAVQRVEILKGPASLAYGSDAISGVINLIPDKALPQGKQEGDVLFNYQTNNGLINNMVHLAGTTKNGISWSGRIDNIMAHAYQNAADSYVLNSQFSDFNSDGTIGLHRKWGYTQLHGSYFDMATGIVDGTRDSVSGAMERQVSYPDLNGGSPSFEIATHQELTSYTPLVINQRIRHSKVVWDNSVAVGSGRITGIFSWQRNQRQETNDPTMPNTPNIYYNSNAATYDVRYISPQMGGFNISGGVNGAYQASQSLGTLMLIPNYNLFQIGAFAIANEQIGKLSLSGGLRFDTRTFNGIDHWVDSTQKPVAANTPGGIHEFQGFTSNFSGMSGSFGAVFNVTKNVYLKGNIAQGFRAPNVAECGANGVHDGTVVYELGDPNLKPETSLEEDFTFGINSKDIGFEADVFNNSISSFIYAKGLLSNIPGVGDSINNSLNAAGLGAAPVYKYTQGDANLYGGEVSLDLHPTAISWLDLNTTLSTVSGGIKNVPDSIKVLPFVPPTRVTADLRFHIKCKKIEDAYIKVGMLDCFQQNSIYQQFAIYNGLTTTNSPEVYAASKAATAGYVLFNAGFGGDIQHKGHTLCKVFVSVNNLFNTVYMDYMSRFKYDPVNYTTGRVGVYNMGTNVSFKVIVPFNL
ncbi:MAG TPA: TonB-dependent receptor [Bacteroidia bacterium]|nr:TonB-dependent receptor [Bacteroidia bacterium]